ncbi:MAG TPA: phospholipase D-like domain-containing protein [Candidatus Dormibacteraeota bacterium]|nr:phospholipase D-like domain-containing protein [Candidatus Dormibacteraeota bacterium]
MAKKNGDEHRLIVQPDDGVAPVVEFIDSATRSLRIKQFTLTDPDVLKAIERAHGRGVAVRVMLNPHRSSGDRANDDTHAALKHAKISVAWTNPAFAVTHEKSVVVDDDTALIATFNLCTKYFTETRDYGIVTTCRHEVDEVIAGFEADWKRETFEPAEESTLLWSATNSRLRMAWFIDAARHGLLIQHPKFVDATIVERIAAARHRGVKVDLLCGGKHGISDWDVLDTFASLRLLDRAGVKVRRQKHLKLHAKLLIIDDTRALAGSMNIDRSAFDLRRELGVVTEEGGVVKRLRKVFDHDWHEAKPYEAPDPLKPETHHEGELPHDPHFKHE